jgi:hypothetical protein
MSMISVISAAVATVSSGVGITPATPALSRADSAAARI